MRAVSRLISTRLCRDPRAGVDKIVDAARKSASATFERECQFVAALYCVLIFPCPISQSTDSRTASNDVYRGR